MNELEIKKQCFEIYKEAFPQPDNGFKERLFEICFDYCVYKLVDNRVVSFFFALPCVLEDIKCTYIFAVATDTRQRGKGYMTELLKSYIATNHNPLFLRPADEGLEQFYHSFGFHKIIGINSTNKAPALLPTASFYSLSKNYADLSQTEYPLMCNKKEIPKKISFPFSMD